MVQSKMLTAGKWQDLWPTNRHGRAINPIPIRMSKGCLRKVEANRKLRLHLSPAFALHAPRSKANTFYC